MSDAGRPANRPNILFVFPDELRPQALGFMRQDPVLTPNIDRFAAESIVLTHCVSNFPVCTPFRGMFLTGRYPYQTGLISNCNTDTTAHGVFLKESERCLSDVLSAQGYDCGYIGKWHLDAPDPADAAWTEGRRGDGVIWDGYTPPGPRRHGFNFWYSYGCCDRHFDPHYWTGDAPVSGRIDPHLWSVEHETNVAVDYIRNSAGCRRDETKPFCLVISHNPPHMPFAEVPDRYKALYAGRSPAELLNRPNLKDAGDGSNALRHVANYFAAISGIDEQFSRLLAALDEKKIADDTIVVFASDHGEMMGSHGRMGKGIFYDESLLVPFILRWRGGALSPRRDNLLMSAPDIFPTLLGLCGLDAHIPPAVSGRNLSRALRPGSPAAAPSAKPSTDAAERPASALYLWPDIASPRCGLRGLRTHRHTYIVDRGHSQSGVTAFNPAGGGSGSPDFQELLFDNVSDPYQRTDIAAAAPALLPQFRLDLARHLARTEDPWSR